MAKYIGVDLGTANTLVYLKGKGIVLKEPSVVAIEEGSGRVLAVGTDAKNMIGRTPDEVLVVRPVKSGVIADFDITQAMLRSFIEKVTPKGILKPNVTICVPYGVTEVEKRAVLEAVMRSGGKNAYLIDEPMAAALGAELPVEEARGSMVVDIGGGTTEVAVVSFGGIVSSTSIKYAGDKMDKDIEEYIKNNYDLMIGERTAEEIKIAIGSAYPDSEEKEISVMGRDLKTGLPKVLTVTSTDVKEAISNTVDKIVKAVCTTLENTPPELASDVKKTGIVLTGGGGKLSGLGELIKEKTGIDTYLTENAEECVAIGAGLYLSRLSERGIYQKSKRSLFGAR